ncbi:hypothetical protein BAR1_04410 [Profundibacter amoris]|uniref:Uncharacterized protein n=1 Tax=Profundibacter amoris TaxID=2171755 RepID=A0A347UEG3_9RHOB|nr:hypothetical protein BAR1_04410 [Profundibacter amoris]
MITDNLIDRLNAQAAHHLVAKVRNGRRRALAIISRYCVVTTDDGRETREVIFGQPPTIGQLEAHVGPDAWVVSVKMRRVPRSARQRQALAAE